jgi:hypothetical protein
MHAGRQDTVVLLLMSQLLLLYLPRALHCSMVAVDGSTNFSFQF